MAHEFKAGDLALVIGSRHEISPNIGKSVELVSYAVPGGEVVFPSGELSIYAGVGPAWLVSGEVQMRKKSGCFMDFGGFAYVLVQHLMPLRGDLEPERQKAKETEPCA